MSNSEIYYRAISFYLEEQPMQLTSLLNTVMSKVDHARVVQQVKRLRRLRTAPRCCAPPHRPSSTADSPVLIASPSQHLACALHAEEGVREPSRRAAGRAPYGCDMLARGRRDGAPCDTPRPSLGSSCACWAAAPPRRLRDADRRSATRESYGRRRARRSLWMWAEGEMAEHKSSASEPCATIFDAKSAVRGCVGSQSPLTSSLLAQANGGAASRHASSRYAWTEARASPLRGEFCRRQGVGMAPVAPCGARLRRLALWQNAAVRARFGGPGGVNIDATSG